MRGALLPLACALSVLAGCTSGGLDTAPAPAPASSVGNGCRTPSPTVRPTISEIATRDRISSVLDAFAQRAWNPKAPAVRPSRQAGGLYINYRPTFDGVAHPESQTNINTSGLSDADAQKNSRHDPLADLGILRDLDAALAAGITTPATERLRCLLQPVTAVEFSSYGPPRGAVYTQLADLSDLDPGGPWRDAARRFALNLATTYSDPTGLGRTESKPQVRPDWAAASAQALVDAGNRFATPAWSALGAQLAVQVVTKTANPVTALFPDTLAIDAAGAVTVTDPLVRVGAEAQLLDALLGVADRTGNGQLRAAVAAGLSAVNSPNVGLLDTAHGGWFFAVAADGSNLRTAYKETRSAWMLPLLQHAARSGLPVAATAAVDAGRLVRDSMFLASSGGYVYRLKPDWTVYRSSGDTTPAAENWVSSEATAIAVNVLLGDLGKVS